MVWNNNSDENSELEIYSRIIYRKSDHLEFKYYLILKYSNWRSLTYTRLSGLFRALCGANGPRQPIGKF